MEVNIQSLKDSRSAMKGVLTRKMNRIREFMASEATQEVIEEVSNLEGLLDETMAKFREVHNEYQSFLTEDVEIELSVAYFDQQLMVFYDFKQQITSWLADQVKPNDSVSNISTRAVSKYSMCSRSSSGSGFLEARLKASARKAALLVEAATLSKKQALATEKLELRLREDRLRLETEIEKIKAQERVYEGFEYKVQLPSSPEVRSSVCSIQRNKDASVVLDVRGKMSIPVSPLTAKCPSLSSQRSFMDESLPHTFIPKPHPMHFDVPGVMHFDADSKDHNQQVLKSIQVVQQQVERQLKAQRLPKADLTPFDGNPMNYFLFIKCFENNVEKCTDDQSERLQLLMQYCTGKAKDIVKGCGMLDADKGYETARKLLEKRFGDKYLVTNAWISRVADGPVIGPNDREALQDLADDLENCEIVLNVAGRLNEINSDDKLIKILQRVPNYLRSRWQSKAREIRDQGKVPTIVHVKDLIANAAREKNDPVFGGILDRIHRDYKKPTKTPSCYKCNKGNQFFMCISC